MPNLAHDGMTASNQVRRFLTKTGFPILFGSKLQELFLKLSFSIANADDDSALPDVMGRVTNATSSPSAIAARKEIAELGEFVTNSATAAPAFEQGEFHGRLDYSPSNANSRNHCLYAFRL